MLCHLYISLLHITSMLVEERLRIRQRTRKITLTKRFHSRRRGFIQSPQPLRKLIRDALLRRRAILARRRNVVCKLQHLAHGIEVRIQRVLHLIDGSLLEFLRGIRRDIGHYLLYCVAISDGSTHQDHRLPIYMARRR